VILDHNAEEGAELERTALVLVDLQTRIVALPTGPRSGIEVVAQARRLAEAFRARSAPVVLVRAERPGQDPQPPGSELVADLGPRPGDLVVTKRATNAFHHTDLHEQLQERGITTLAIGGIATNWGVESTARSAEDYAYQVLLVEDAMTGLDARAHAFAVEMIFPHIGTVCGSDEVLARLAEEPQT
jgi:nicotinamidase-related amidase